MSQPPPPRPEPPRRLPGAPGPLPEPGDYRESEQHIAGRLSTMPAFAAYHPAEALPYARAALDALAEWGAQDRTSTAEEQIAARRAEIKRQTLVEIDPRTPPATAPAPTPPTPPPTPPTASPSPTPTPTPTPSPTVAEYLAEQARQDALEDARQAAEARQQIADAPPEPQP